METFEERVQRLPRSADAGPLVSEVLESADFEAMCDVANTLRTMGRPGDAVPLLERVVEILERDLGSEDEIVAQFLYNLAWLLDASDQDDQAEPLYRRSLEIYGLYQRREGHRHEAFETVFNNYVNMLQEWGLDRDDVRAGATLFGPGVYESLPPHEELIRRVNERLALARHRGKTRVAAYFETLLGADAIPATAAKPRFPWLRR